MSEITFESDILYSQIAVFQYGLENPFNDWNDTHVNQGFAWRKGSVSFGTMSDDEECKITVRVSDVKEVDTDAIRAITVPFYISNKGIEVGSIIETKAIDIEQGMYELLFTVQRLGNGLDHYTFSFMKNDNPLAKIIKADEELNPPSVLVMNAEPAI
ncbi:competence protein [Halobacillus locisalis]|uniref:Competence protein n=1 Tax=Halobacillus locisalis TaxID=220753 RepID=A0A838CSY4_9BACI|nr:competence protein ComJ [Halobacillus locisalis]MBA2174875.1 competence protein [Halobacillus locisalis]